MKKVIVGLVAVGAIVALRSAAGRSGHSMSEHCKQMAGRCKQMMAGQPADRGPAAGMREHCNEMMAARRGQGEATESGEHSEQEAPQVVGSGETVDV